MRRIGAEIAAGVTIFLAIIIFVAGFLFIKNITLKAGKYHIIVNFDDVTGLERHDQVNVSGLAIGKVKAFNLHGRKVAVTVELGPEAEIPVDSRAQIKTLGMVGEKFIDIVPGASTDLLQDGDSIKGKAASDFAEITGTMEGLMKQAEDLVQKVHSTFDNVFDDPTQTNLKNSVHNISQLSTMFDDNKARMQKTLTNLEQLSTNLNEVLAERRGKIETSIDNIHAATNRLDDLTSKLDKSLTSVNNLLAKIEKEEGTVGKMIARDDMYNDLRHLTAELDTLVQDLKKRPQKYLNLGFIKVF